MTTQEQVKAIADAVLYEGFLLFPYKPSALKNQLPWQFGVLMPIGYADTSETTSMQSQMVIVPRGTDASIDVVARFLQFDGPVEHEVPTQIPLRGGAMSLAFEAGPLQGILSVRLEHDGDLFRLTLELRNTGSTAPQSNRNEALGSALISAHAVLTAHDAAFVSLLDPPAEAAEAVKRCRNRGVFPVLAGRPDEGKQTAETILVSPIVLYDFPSIAQQSKGHTFDATEIDELLMLTVASLTDEEKREVRATHPYARDLVERAEALDADTQALLHGELTGGHREPGDETVEIAGTTVKRGSHVRVFPSGRADVWDDIVRGMSGQVCAIHTDFEDRRYVGVIFDGDPAGDMHEWYGRSFFFRPDEIEPLDFAT
jgi:hypothetical protein